MSAFVGQTLANRYRAETFLGRGGMADVYKVWDQRRTAYLAMKVLHEDLAEDNVFLRRFKREAQTLERLQHPNIVRFYGLEEDGDLAFLLMDYIEGSTLRKEIHRLKAPFPTQRILEIMRPVCSALHYAHQSGFVHCDVKPANIMIHANGTVLVSDFGISRMTESASTMTMVGAGTPAYMAPEQARGENPTPQTDIYALGVVLFEMLTGGERPFTGENARTTGSTSEKIRWEQVYLESPSPRGYNPAISAQLEEIVLRCLNKNPAARYSNTLELLVALETVIGAHRSQATRSSQTGPASAPGQTNNQGQTNLSRRSSRTAWIVMGSILLIFILLVCGATSLFNFASQQAQANAEATGIAIVQVNVMNTANAESTEMAIAQANATDTANAESTETAIAQINAIGTANADATATAEAPLSSYTSWNLILSEPFIDNSNGWATGDVATDLWTGNSQITNGKLIWNVQQSPSGFVHWDWPKPTGSLTDFYASIDVQQTSGPNSDCYGLWFRGSGFNYYTFKVCDSQNYSVMSHSDNNGWTVLLGPTSATAIQPGQVNRLAIGAKGSYFEFYINDQLVDSLNNSQHASGDVGIMMDVNKGDTPTFDFDNFEVRAP